MSVLGYNPLHCIDCNLEIRPENLDLPDDLINLIANWQSVYNALDRLWLDSAEYEIWAKEQLAAIKSPINQRGMELCKRINDNVCRCHYWYFQDQSADDFEPVDRCPNCNQILDLYPDGIFSQSICEKCSIIASRV